MYISCMCSYNCSFFLLIFFQKKIIPEATHQKTHQIHGVAMYNQFLISQEFEARSNVNTLKVQRFHHRQKMRAQSRHVKKHTDSD